MRNGCTGAGRAVLTGLLTGGVALFAAAAVLHAADAAPRGGDPPPVSREFRGVWVATVDNIDWPSKPGLPTEQQQAEARALLDRAVQLRLNAIVFQVRPSCDSLYASKLEPWSDYLTGVMGKAPEPFYDPLEFWVEEAHRRGLELHAWFNPYRARHPSGKSPISADHISRTRPALVRQYGKHLWLDPGDAEVQAHSLAVIQDVVRRYDIDGVHIDDYFYPYKERDAEDRIIPFPDDPSWQAYQRAGGRLERDDWRRENVNTFVRRLYAAVKEEKRWVKFGISPFGIGRPGHPPQIKGFDQFTELYADARKWLVNGWCDYFSPQLYWKIEQTAQSYPVLLKWWSEQNTRKRHLWPGNFTSRIMQKQWPEDEVRNQIEVTRRQPGAGGNIHFSAKALAPGLAADRWPSTVYARPALVPPSPWLDGRRPAAPRLRAAADAACGGGRLEWEPARGAQVWLWVVQIRQGGQWTEQVLPGAQRSCALEAQAERAVVTAVSRTGVEGKPAALELAR